MSVYPLSVPSLTTVVPLKLLPIGDDKLGGFGATRTGTAPDNGDVK